MGRGEGENIVQMQNGGGDESVFKNSNLYLSLKVNLAWRQY